MAEGPILTPVTAAEGSSIVMALVAELAEIGSAKDGFPLKPLTVFGSRCLSQDRVTGAHSGFAISEGIPSETNTRLEIQVVLLVWLGRRNQSARRRIKVRESANRFRWRCIPGVAEADVDRKIWLPLETVLGESVIGWLKDSVIAGT